MRKKVLAYTVFPFIFLLPSLAMPLPVDLVSYNVAARPDHTVLISWKTAQETNRDHFLMERSTDGQHFSLLAKIAGKGTDAGVSDYSYIDDNPRPGNNFYRLTQYGPGSKVTDYGIKMVNLRSIPTTYMVSPNPAIGGSVTVSISAEPEDGLSYKILDMNGSPVKAGKVRSRNQAIDISGLAAGVYIIHLSNGTVLRFQRN